MRLFSKIYICLLLGFVGLLMVEGNSNYELQIRRFNQLAEDHAKEITETVAGLITSTWRHAGPEQAKQLLAGASDASRSFTIVSDAAARTRFSDRWLPPGEPVDGTRVFAAAAGDGNDRTRRYVITPLPITEESDSLLLLEESLAMADQFNRQLLIRSLLITAALVLVGGLLLYLFIYNHIHRPLTRLSRKALEIGRGNVTADLDVQGDDELAGLSRSMNDMCTRLLIAKEKIHFEYLARLKTLEQLRHTEKLSTIGQISAGIAHEMGTPLNVVDGRAKMIIDDRLEQKEIVHCAEVIRNQAAKMTLIIRQLLDFARKKKGGPRTREHIEHLVEQVVRLLAPIASRQQVRIVVRTAPDTRLYCRVDNQQIQQVLMNVIINAIQASPPEGLVQVEIANTVLRSFLHTDDRPREVIRIEVLDEGPGIPEHQLQEIFTPFFTTKQIGLGTGLGLSIAQELLEEHDGWIEVRNRSLHGAHFSIFLPPEETIA